MRPWTELERISSIVDDKEAMKELGKFLKTLKPSGEAWRLLPPWVPGMVGLS